MRISWKHSRGSPPKVIAHHSHLSNTFWLFNCRNWKRGLGVTANWIFWWKPSTRTCIFRRVLMYSHSHSSATARPLDCAHSNCPNIPPFTSMGPNFFHIFANFLATGFVTKSHSACFPFETRILAFEPSKSDQGTRRSSVLNVPAEEHRFWMPVGIHPPDYSVIHQDVAKLWETCNGHGVLSLRLTHSDIGKLVSGAMRVDAVEVRTITIHSSQDQSCSNVALIPKKVHTLSHSHICALQRLFFKYKTQM